MSLPPATVHIKRKATDEPVDFLRVHELPGKRQRRAADFIFSRQTISKPETYPASSLGEVGRAKDVQEAASSLSQFSQPEEISRPGASDSRKEQTATNLQSEASPRKRPAEYGDSNTPLLAAQVRRFHMSRNPTDSTRDPTRTTQARKRTAQPSVFVERKARGKKPESEQQQNGESVNPTPKQSQAQKKPGLAARIQAVPVNDATKPPPVQAVKTDPSRDVQVPSGLMMPWDVNSAQLAAEMQAYTLQEIGRNIAQSEATKPGTRTPAIDSRNTKPPSRFKPKKPALRYHERHPNGIHDGHDRMDTDDNFSDDDLEYIIDTYIRIPADSLESPDSQKNIGLLVLDSQPDIDKFYLQDSDSDEEEDEDDDDENAENHYTADYPDDEVDSDDEYNRNPYLYRTHNASDLEEFDEDDATFSDDEADATKYPWANRQFVRQPEKHGALLDGDE